MVDQSPISRSARSAPVTYVKAFDPIRKAFADTVEARTRNLTAGHFSFNSDKGQCPSCEGAGVLEIDMQFLADVSMRCPACRGTRYRDEILQVRYRDRSIDDVLEHVDPRSPHVFSRRREGARSRLQRMIDVGLDYIKLGQARDDAFQRRGPTIKVGRVSGWCYPQADVVHHGRTNDRFALRRHRPLGRLF